MYILSGSLFSLSLLSTIVTPITTRTLHPPPHSSLPPGYTSSASSHTPCPLQEEKTEPYYANDSYKDPPPPAHVLTREFGVKIRDFMYEKGGGVGGMWVGVKGRRRGRGGEREVVLVQRQPTPPGQRGVDVGCRWGI
ncbi:hypothetical protein C8J55DRAFT_252663 [Lentinula edodes]|uniref:Uncharacterized protein n=1 Tax=Lentinula lateritia TaxID=40482 RepID=A0A9W9DZN0_9AGAR|nr:hypothetical protein C8J55DRAFT_252663 [Lentinula edodes]